MKSILLVEEERYKTNTEEPRAIFKTTHKNRKNSLKQKTFMVQKENSNVDMKLIFDNGSTRHMSRDKNNLTEIRETKPMNIEVVKVEETMIANLTDTVPAVKVVPKDVTFTLKL